MFPISQKRSEIMILRTLIISTFPLLIIWGQGCGQPPPLTTTSPKASSTPSQSPSVKSQIEKSIGVTTTGNKLPSFHLKFTMQGPALDYTLEGDFKGKDFTYKVVENSKTEEWVVVGNDSWLISGGMPNSQGYSGIAKAQAWQMKSLDVSAALTGAAQGQIVPLGAEVIDGRETQAYTVDTAGFPFPPPPVESSKGIVNLDAQTAALIKLVIDWKALGDGNWHAEMLVTNVGKVSDIKLPS